jgi:hypothetical protein
MKRRLLTRILTVLALSACSGPSQTDAGQVDAGAGEDGGHTADAGREPDAGADAGPPVETLTVERWGERLYGRVLGMNRIGRELWIGTSAVIDPSLGDTSPIRSGLARLDLDSGMVRVFEAELPRFPGDFAGEGPAPTAGVVADGDRRLAVSRVGILSIEDDEVTLHEIDIEGANASPSHLAVDHARDVLWASTDLGLLELDLATLAVNEVHDVGGQPLSVAVDPESGAAYVAVFPTSPPSVLVRVFGDDVQTLTPGADGVPSGQVGTVVWSEAHGVAFIALASWDPASGGVITWDGTDVGVVANEGALSTAARGEAGRFGAQTLAFDESSNVLVVGGRIRSAGGSLQGGGLAWIDVTDLSRPGLTGVSSGTTDMRGDDVSGAAYDPTDHRTYVGLQQPCNESRIGNVGVHAIAFERGRPRFEVPILSTVRDLERVDGQLWIGLRDDNSAIACDGVQAQVGFMQVRGDRAGVVPEIRSSIEGWRASSAGTTEIAFRGIERRAFTGPRSELFVGSDTGLLLNPALDIGTSLWTQDIAWQDDHTFWVASFTSHSTGDPPQTANTGPRGAARVVLNDAGAIESVTQYVRQNRDFSPTVIEGLPSAEVYDVIVDDAGVYLVCGTERVIGSYDRSVRDVFALDGQIRPGGVARIEADGSITIIAHANEVPDGRAGAIAPDGTLWILDATRGLLRQNGDDFEQVELAGVPEGAIGQTLWVGEGDDIVVGYDVGAFVRLGGETRFIDDVGFIWSIDASEDVVLLGTDRGLVRLIPAGMSDAGEMAPLPSEAPPFAGTEPPPPDDAGVPFDAGSCTPEGSVCNDSTVCCPSLECRWAGIARTCAPL